MLFIDHCSNIILLPSIKVKNINFYSLNKKENVENFYFSYTRLLFANYYILQSNYLAFKFTKIFKNKFSPLFNIYINIHYSNHCVPCDTAEREQRHDPHLYNIVYSFVLNTFFILNKSFPFHNPFPIMKETLLNCSQNLLERYKRR